MSFDVPDWISHFFGLKKGQKYLKYHWREKKQELNYGWIFVIFLKNKFVLLYREIESTVCFIARNWHNKRITESNYNVSYRRHRNRKKTSSVWFLTLTKLSMWGVKRSRGGYIEVYVCVCVCMYCVVCMWKGPFFKVVICA